MWYASVVRSLDFDYMVQDGGALLTNIYYVRHAEPNYSNHNDVLRELSPKGMVDRELVTKFLSDKQIDMIVSSP